MLIRLSAVAYSPSTLVLVIATISSLGFVINFGVPTVAASAWQIVSGKDNLEILQEPSLRFLSRFANTRWIVFFYGVSISFLAASLLELVAFLVPDYQLFRISDIISTGAVISTIFGSLVLVVIASVVFPKDVKKVIEFAGISPRRRASKKGTGKKFCVNCGNKVGTDDKFCSNCGKNPKE